MPNNQLPSLKNLVSNFKDINFLFGASAAWYLTFFTSQSGLFITAPILFLALATLFLKKNTEAVTNKHWLFALAAFGIYSTFTVWMNQGTNRDYETAAKYLLGAFLFWRLAKYKIEIAWIKTGAILGSLVTLYLVVSMYHGQHRFSAYGNVIKWGNLVSYQALLLICLAIQEKRSLMRITILALSINCIYATFITGTRGALLPLVSIVPLLLYIYINKFSRKIAFITLVFVTSVGTFAIQSDTLTKRMHHTADEIIKITNGNYIGSIGYRLTMWDAGIQAGLTSPIIGYSYDLRNMWNDYDPSFQGMDISAERLEKWTSKLHNTYIDTFSSKGLIGLLILFYLIYSAFKLKKRDNKILLFSPIIGVAVSGLADSTFDIGPTTEYFIIVGSILALTKHSKDLKSSYD